MWNLRRWHWQVDLIVKNDYSRNVLYHGSALTFFVYNSWSLSIVGLASWCYNQKGIAYFMDYLISYIVYTRIII